ncbi:putative F-box/LRR-repeat protein at3g28410 [Phtheirospermum japonicum]|uniref:Putative F-box/LRR-repeat protein at3g28410 n=1 Tax=Phtheirospermum japonicum TaxID=374723 RepID=A0A830D4I1_9LAMI|nr:putative F-box/LRR-repeat protein at3g28410 [Phtheirospermum japonicum]
MMTDNKQVKETPIDRLSSLPDSIIIHILSFLQVKHSAVTAVLSTRWRYLWPETPILIFREKSSCPETTRNFVTRTHRTLVLCGRNGLETFEIEFSYSNVHSLDVDVWVDFVVRNKVKQVSLLLNSSPSSQLDFYLLPQMIFRNSFLKRLILRRCDVSPRRAIEWRSLTELLIGLVELQQHVIENILSGCPVLNRLYLLDCWGFNRLEVESKCLYELRVSDRDDGVNEPVLRISAPYVNTLWVSRYVEERKLSLGNVSSLAKATIDLDGSCWNTATEEVMNNAKELLEKTRHAKAVESRCGYTEVLSAMAMCGYQFPQSARKYLLVRPRAEKAQIHGIAGLLESSPNLEALFIEGEDLFKEPRVCPDPKADLDRDLLHLKTITIKDFIDPNLVGEPMLTLARILLKKAPALEKMVVNIRVDVNEPVKIAQTLLSYPRSSKEAVVLLN